MKGDGVKKFQLIGALAGLVLLVIVILQNSVPVTVKVLFLSVTLPNSLLMGLTVLVGMALGFFVAFKFCGKRPESTASRTPP